MFKYVADSYSGTKAYNGAKCKSDGGQECARVCESEIDTDNKSRDAEDEMNNGKCNSEEDMWVNVTASSGRSCTCKMIISLVIDSCKLSFDSSHR